MIVAFLSQLWVPRLGWTLLHFLWQGTLVAILYAALRGLLGRSLSAQGRYVLACLALVTMTIAPPLTFLLIPKAGGSAVPVVSWDISAAGSQQLLSSVVATWLLGVVAFSIRLFGGWRFTARLRALSHPAPAEWQQSLERIAARVGASRPVRLLVSSLVEVPVVIGWLRPVILLPVGSLTGLPVEHITALLAHELAHIRRHDYLASILQSIAEAVLFYHPAVWWVSQQIRAERELCCDDLAVAASGDVLTYARALAELESQRSTSLRPALAASGGSLVNRVRRLIEPSQPITNNLPGPGAAWAMSLLWLVGVGVVTIHAAQTPAPRVVNIPPMVQPAPASAPAASPVLSAFLYDPFLPAPPAAQTAPNTPAATLKGRVLEERSGTAVAWASLRIQQPGAWEYAAEVETDTQGRFEVDGLAEGTYRIEVSKRNHVSSVSYRRLSATDTSAAEGFTLWLANCGSISGRAVYQDGEPMSGAAVLVVPRPAEGQPLGLKSEAARTARVDEQGQYRIANLPPGDYAVAIYWSGSAIARSGVVFSATTASKFGSGVLFYPNSAQMEFVNVSGGEEKRGVDFAVVTPSLQELSGKVELSAPNARFDVALVLRSQPAVAIAGAVSGSEGLFRFAGIPPGAYEIIASGPTGRPSGEAPMYARTRIDVVGVGTQPVTLTPRPSQSVTVQLRRAENRLPPACPQAVALTLTPLSDWGATHTRRATASVGRDTVIAGVAPDQYRVSPQKIAEGCYIAGTGILDLREASTGSPVTMTLSAGGTIQGRVSAGKLGVSEVAVILVPVGQPGSDSPNRVAHPGRDWRFSFSQLPPGSYRIGTRLLRRASGSNSDGEPGAMLPVQVSGQGAVEIDLTVNSAESDPSDAQER